MLLSAKQTIYLKKTGVADKKYFWDELLSHFNMSHITIAFRYLIAFQSKNLET